MTSSYFNYNLFLINISYKLCVIVLLIFSIGSKAVGHLTHGYPNIPASQGKVVNLDANEDAKKLPEPQNAVMYVKGKGASCRADNRKYLGNCISKPTSCTNCN